MAKETGRPIRPMEVLARDPGNMSRHVADAYLVACWEATMAVGRGELLQNVTLPKIDAGAELGLDWSLF